MIDVPHGSISGRTEDELGALPKPRCLLHLAAFNAYTLIEIGQQVDLFRTFETRRIDVHFVSKTRIQCPTSMIALQDKRYFSWFILLLSGDSISGVH